MKAVDGCIKCGACLKECPVMQLEATFPGPRRLAAEGPRFSAPLDALAEPLEMCTTCARCEAACPSRLQLTDAIVRLRSETERDGEGRRRMLLNARQLGRTIAPQGRVSAPSKGETLFFPGCVGEARLLSSVRSAVDLLLRVDRGIYVPERWSCCGSPLEKIGEREEAKRLQDLNTPLLEAAGEVVTACPGCAVQLQRAHGVRPLHALEHLYETVGPARLGLRSRKIKVALHSPCHLVRTIGPHTMDYAREILGAVPGVTVVELEEDQCCGGGGGVASARSELALSLARRKTGAAARAGAEVLLAPCPFCVINLRKAGGVEVQELTSFLNGLSGDQC